MTDPNSITREDALRLARAHFGAGRGVVSGAYVPPFRVGYLLRKKWGDAQNGMKLFPGQTWREACSAAGIPAED